jgi:hypothetical protein
MSRYRRRRHPARAIVLGGALLIVLDVVAWAVWALWRLAPLLLLAGVVVVAWRAWRRRGLPRRGAFRPPAGEPAATLPRWLSGPVLPRSAWLRTPAGEPASDGVPAAGSALEAERDDLRRQVAKLEDDAARHDQLIEDLEAVAGRPVEAVIASYRHLQRQYRDGGPR